MEEKGVIQMITDKLDRLEDKVDSVKDKLNEFELSAQHILTTHDNEIKSLSKKIGDLEGKKSTENWMSKVFNDSALSTWLFRLLLILFLTLFGMKKDNIQTVIDLSKQQTIEKVNTVDKK